MFSMFVVQSMTRHSCGSSQSGQFWLGTATLLVAILLFWKGVDGGRGNCADGGRMEDPGDPGTANPTPPGA